jgi:hypothetical protein
MAKSTHARLKWNLPMGDRQGGADADASPFAASSAEMTSPVPSFQHKQRKGWEGTVERTNGLRGLRELRRVSKAIEETKDGRGGSVQ